MTPKEKAKELIDNFYNLRGMDWDMSISCSLIAVDEILNIDNIKPYILHKQIIKYYIEVKQEIEKL
jgi:hypothetical protein